MAQSKVYNIPVAGTDVCENELQQMLPLTHLVIVFHLHMESVQPMLGDVTEQLGQV